MGPEGSRGNDTLADATYARLYPVARRGISEAEQHLRAVQAARRMISRGVRPGYRRQIVQNAVGAVAWSLDGLPGVVGIAPSRREAPAAARAVVAAVLEVPSDSFDVE